MSANEHPSARTETAVLGGGCFWCVEAVYKTQAGVHSVRPGYAGGWTENPTYERVCGGATGHAEVVEIIFDPDQIRYTGLLDIFWRAHDPTTLNRQGADTGTQYRSLILYTNDVQKTAAEQSKAAAQKKFAAPIVTEIAPLERFYPAEDHHQDYYSHHRQAPYCRLVIAPKLKKLGLE